MKKSILLILINLIIAYFSFGQPWVKNLPAGKSKKEVTLKEHKKAFEDYWSPLNVNEGFYVDKSGKKTKALGWKQFKRWEYYWEPKVDSEGRFPEVTALEVFRNYIHGQPSLKSAQAANWSCFGPDNTTGGYAGIGRINCVAFHPTDNNTYWVGAASGGLWKTTNNGNTWECLTDDNPVLGISDIVIPSDYSTSSTIYIATGDRDAFDNNSVGVLKTTDGGITWLSTGLNFSLSDYRMVSRLLLDPDNNNTILAATSDGVYKTTNGGINWINRLTTLNFIDMEYQPGNFNILYCSTKYGDIYKSTDGGSNWDLVLDTDARRVEMAVSANEPTWLYAVVGNVDDGLYGVYKSENSGTNFVQVFSGSTTNLLGWYADGSDEGGQAWYDLALAVSPSNANLVLLGGINTWRSTDGGSTWNCVNHWWGQNEIQPVHADKHMLKYRNDGYLFECNDGGIYVSDDNGISYNDKSNGLVISQMYKLSVAQTNANTVLTGLQDNGTKLFGNEIWRDINGGDGMECIIDYTDELIQYSSIYYGGLSRTTDNWNSQTDITPPDAGEGSWVTPFVMDPFDHNTLYAGYGDIWKTVNKGNSWNKISDINLPYKFRSLAVAPSDNNYIYAAGSYELYSTADGGVNWTNVSYGLPSEKFITGITVKYNDPNILWVTFGEYDSHSVYQSTDGGQSWTNISAGLPELPVYTLVQNKQETNTIHLYAGAEIGVYFKNGDENWELYSTGLPNVTTRELEIYYNEYTSASRLRLATYGRGLWESNLADVSTAVPMTFLSSTTTQRNISAVKKGAKNQEIIGIEIKTAGSLSPLSVTSFTFNTLGSTNAAGDIENARLWYTGNNSNFATYTPFGDVVLSPQGTFSITGNQTLQEGANYFWLSYDIKSGATETNKVDAQSTDFIIAGETKVPGVTDPDGSRTIYEDICETGIVNYPWNEDFESGSLPECWQQEYVINTLDWSFQSGGHNNNPAPAHGGVYNALFFYDDYVSNKTKLITPKLDLTVMNSPELKFWHTQANWLGDQDILRIYYKTSLAGNWILLSEYTNDISIWTEEKIILPNPSNDYYIAFEAETAYGFGVCVDDVIIRESKLAADFIGNKKSGVVPLAVQFTDKSFGNPTNWSWEFGDGEGSTEQYPFHKYQTPGKYNVQLIVSNNIESDTILKPTFIHVTDITSKAICNYLRITDGKYSETDNLNEKIQAEFGSNYLIADWLDLTAIDDIEAWIACMDILEDFSFMVTNNGNYFYNSTRQYLVQYSSDGLPPGFLAHAQKGPLYLGSWYGLNMNILTKNQNPLERQQIKLSNGWNIISLCVMPENKNLLNIFQALILNNSLVKIQDESGNSIEKLGINSDWMNNIGDIALTEGYKVKVGGDDSIQVYGTTIANYPYAIPLKTGWNIVGYSQTNSFDGLEVVQELITRNTLIKVQDEAGNSIEYLSMFNDWTNNIGNFEAGDGYKIKVSADDTLWISDSYPKSTTVQQEKVMASHFIPAYKGNGTDHMNIFLVNPAESGLQNGDEIGIFDGNICVGSVKISNQLPLAIGIILSIPVSANDGIEEKNGFTGGNPIEIRLYRNGREYPVTLKSLSHSKTVFYKGESLFAMVDLTTGLEGKITGTNQPEINCYPNPFSDEVNIEIKLVKDSEVQVEVLNQLGQKMKFVKSKQMLPVGICKLTWNGRNTNNQQVSPGIYYLYISIDNIVYYRKIIFSK